MNKEKFVQTLITADSVWEIILSVQKTIEENEVIHPETGDRITLDTKLASLRFEPKKPNMPTVRVQITVGTTRLSVDEQVIEFPTAFLCTFFREMAEVHETWHEVGGSLTAMTAESFLGEMEKVIAETLSKGFTYLN